MKRSTSTVLTTLAIVLGARSLGAVTPPRPGRATESAPASASGPDLPFVKYTLGNGLEVILHEDHRVPTVAVDVWFKVGSKDEQPGRTGFAHLFEHVMFQGSKHVGEDKHFALLQKAGVSAANGSTSEDRTNYFEVVPSDQLELALWLESDRMGFLLERNGLQETFDGQRDVVKNERRQRIENRPMGLVNRVLLEALYPPSHPYHHEVIGSMEDLSRASLEDVKAFFHRYYAPSNASLVLVGDFEPARAKTLIEQYFGPIPSGLPIAPGTAAPGGAATAAPPTVSAGAPISRPAPPPVTLRAESRIALEAKVQQPQVFIDYPTPRSLTDGDHALDVTAQILAGGKASRLYKRLVYDLQIAQSVSAHQQSQLLQSVFEISATPIAGHTLDEIVRVIDEEMESLRTRRVEPGELERAKNQIEFDTFRSLEAPLAQAERLQTYNLLVGDPGYLARDIEMYRAVDAAAVQATAGQYLRKDGRVVVTVTPNPDAPIMGRVKPQ